MPLRRVHAPHPTAWIDAARPLFPARVKILHRILEDLSITDHDLTWSEAEQRQIPDPDPAVAAYLANTVLAGSTPDKPLLVRRVLWRDAAERYGIPFDPGIQADDFTQAFPTRSWPRYLIGPDEGSLDLKECEALVSVLARATPGECCFWHWFMTLWNYEDGDLGHGVLHVGPLATVTEFLTEVNPVVRDWTPTYWWPMDRSWLVYTDYDLCSTEVSGSRALIAALLEDAELECVEVPVDGHGTN